MLFSLCSLTGHLISGRLTIREEQVSKNYSSHWLFFFKDSRDASVRPTSTVYVVIRTLVVKSLINIRIAGKNSYTNTLYITVNSNSTDRVEKRQGLWTLEPLMGTSYLSEWRNSDILLCCLLVRDGGSRRWST